MTELSTACTVVRFYEDEDMSGSGDRRAPRTLAENLAPVRVEGDVAWGEMDAFQHVNNIIYLRWFENARIQYFMRTGFIAHMEASGIGPILAESRCRYRVPVTFPDRVTVTVTARDLGEDRFTMDYCLYSQQHDCLVAEGESSIVCYDFKVGAKAKLPAQVRLAMEALESAID